MPRLSADQWETIRAEREAGASFGDLAAKHGVTKTAIVNRSTREGWGDGQDVAEVIRRKVTEKVTGVTGANPAKKAAAIEAAADVGAAVILKHQSEWSDHRERFGSVPSAGITPDLNADGRPDAEEVVKVIRIDIEATKLAKLAAEMLKIRQEGERKAYGLEKEQPQGGASQAPVIYLPANGR